MQIQRLLKQILSVVFVSAMTVSSHADVIELKNGSSLEGKVEIETSGFVVLRLASGGVLRVEKRQIDSFRRESVEPVFDEPTPTATAKAKTSTDSKSSSPTHSKTESQEVATASKQKSTQAVAEPEEESIELSEDAKSMLNDMSKVMEYRRKALDSVMPNSGVDARTPNDAERAAMKRVLDMAKGSSGSRSGSKAAQGLNVEKIKEALDRMDSKK
ncbi:MAG: hypothetical protein AAF517_07245 [Planctomycetota bacterium]